MISVKQFENTFYYFEDLSLQEEFLRNYFEPMIVHVIKKGSLTDFQDLYFFINKVPKHINGYIKWKNLFELQVFKYADAEKIRFIFSSDKELGNNFNYLQILLRSGKEDHIKALYAFKKDDNFFINEETYSVLFDVTNFKQIDVLMNIFKQGQEEEFKNVLIISMIKYAATTKNEELLKYAVDQIHNNLTLRRIIPHCIRHFYNSYAYASIVFMDQHQDILKGIIVCNADDYAHLIKYTTHLPNYLFEILDYITPRMLAQNEDGFITTLEEIQTIIFEPTDLILCKKLFELIKELKPELLFYLQKIYSNSHCNKIKKLII